MGLLSPHPFPVQRGRGCPLFLTKRKATLMRGFQVKFTAGAVAGSSEHIKWMIGQEEASGSQVVTSSPRGWQTDQSSPGKLGAWGTQRVEGGRNLTVEWS